jgi:hypothetical protein
MRKPLPFWRVLRHRIASAVRRLADLIDGSENMYRAHAMDRLDCDFYGNEYE